MYNRLFYSCSILLILLGLRSSVRTLALLNFYPLFCHAQCSACCPSFLLFPPGYECIIADIASYHVSNTRLQSCDFTFSIPTDWSINVRAYIINLNWRQCIILHLLCYLYLLSYIYTIYIRSLYCLLVTLALKGFFSPKNGKYIIQSRLDLLGEGCFEFYCAWVLLAIVQTNGSSR